MVAVRGRRLVVAIALVCFAAGGCVCAAGKDCYDGKGKATREIGGFLVKISANPDWRDLEDEPCRAVVLDKKRKTIFSAEDELFSIVLAGQDVNGDGVPDVVIDGYSGGAHCCWTYYTISLGEHPGLITKFENERDAAFLKDEETGRLYISTLDGAFDYFDGLCHACTPFPQVFLRIEDKKVVDISPEFVEAYNKIISKNRAGLTAEGVARVTAMKTNPSESGSFEAPAKILSIVFAYLYSGREDKARRELQAMWPPFDQDRMWNLIQQRRREGILRYAQNASEMSSAEHR